jgi:hypothetical protein
LSPYTQRPDTQRIHHHCVMCGYDWYGLRTTSRPYRCARCGSAKWWWNQVQIEHAERVSELARQRKAAKAAQEAST